MPPAPAWKTLPSRYLDKTQNKMEFINNKITTRKKLAKYLLGALTFLTLTYLIKYLLAPDAVKEGTRSSRYYFSFNELIGISIMTFVILLIGFFASRLILRIAVSEVDHTMTVEIIKPFKFFPRTYTVPLSMVKISDTEIDEPLQSEQTKTSKILTLRNDQVGTLQISEIDFGEIDPLIDYFNNLKTTTADRLRQRRLATKRINRKPSR